MVGEMCEERGLMIVQKGLCRTLILDHPQGSPTVFVDRLLLQVGEQTLSAYDEGIYCIDLLLSDGGLCHCYSYQSIDISSFIINQVFHLPVQ